MDKKFAYYEIDFKDGYSIVIKSKREPTLEEANRWLAEDVKKYGPVTLVGDEISREDAEKFYDFSTEKDWPVFPTADPDNIQTVSDLIEVLKDCPPDAKVRVIMDGVIGKFVSINADDGTVYVESGVKD